MAKEAGFYRAGWTRAPARAPMSAMRKLALPILLLTLAAACTSARVTVDHQQGIDGAWQMPEGKTPTLDATGDEVTLRYCDRIFVFPMVSCRGYLSEEEVRLESPGIRVRLTPDHVHVEDDDSRTDLPMDEMPVNKRLVYRGGDFEWQ